CLRRPGSARGRQHELCMGGEPTIFPYVRRTYVPPNPNPLRMPSSRAVPALVSVLLLSACAVADTAPPIGAEPLRSVPPAESAAPEPAAPPEEPEPSLEERWRAPFAVASRGRPAPREERRVAVRATETTPVA